MTADNILNEWQKRKLKPVYWLEGEEDYYIDKLVDFAEANLLSPDEVSFNLTVFYGKDANFSEIINACRRYPMFAEKQLVILKEAQHMKDLESLSSYIEVPLASTIFIVAHKQKTLDKRKSFYKTVQAHAVYFLSSKLSEAQLGNWIISLAEKKGFTIRPKAVMLMEEHIGNDLSRISNELDKIALNLGDKKTIDEGDIEKYIGINKEYNVFELQAAIVNKELLKAMKIVHYFEHNPKAGPLQYVLPTLYSLFSKAYAAAGLKDKSDQSLKSIFFYPAAIQQGKTALTKFGYAGIEKTLLLLHQYNLKGIGIGNSGTNDAALMKEMIMKILI